MAAIPAGIAKDGGKAVGTAAAAGMLALRTGDHFDDVVAYVQPPTGPGIFEPIMAGVINPIPPPKPVNAELPYVRPFTYDDACLSARRAVRADEQEVRKGRRRAHHVRPRHEHRADA